MGRARAHDQARLSALVLDEDELQQAVIAVARLLGYRVAHFRAAKTARGWRTPVEADGAGFPDLVLMRPGRLVVAELKGEGGRLSAEQVIWIGDFGAAGVETYVWRPADWHSGAIERTLR